MSFRLKIGCSSWQCRHATVHQNVVDVRIRPICLNSRYGIQLLILGVTFHSQLQILDGCC